MRSFVLAILCASAFVALPAEAACVPTTKTPPEKLFGYCCSTPGQTVMDDDNLNIIACLCGTKSNCTNPGDLVWKAMSKGNAHLDVDCAKSGKILAGISGGVPICIEPKTVTNVVTRNITVTPPPLCPAINLSCIEGVGCSGGCHGGFDANLPGGLTTGTMALSGSCNTGDYSCAGRTCSVDITYSGTAICNAGTWYCNITKTRTPIDSAWPGTPNISTFYNGNCAGVPVYH